MRLGVVVGLVAVAIPASLGVAAELTSQPAQHYFGVQAANALYSQGRWADAARAYDALTAAYPENGVHWSRQATAYENAGDAARAVKAYEQVKRLGYDDSADARSAAPLYVQLGRPNDALRWLEHGLYVARMPGRTTLQTDAAFASLRSDKRFK